MRYEDFAVQLQRELPGWVSAGLVSGEQAEALSRRYGAGAGAERRRSRAVQAIALIGAVAAGLGVILFFASNWDAISRPLRVAVLIAALLASYAAGRVMLDRRPIVAQALLLLGGIAFGAGIFLVGQMYHVQAHDPLAFALWSAGIAPLAWTLRSRPLATLSLLTLAGWVVHEAVDLLDDGETALFGAPLALMLYGVAAYGLGTAVRDLAPWAGGPARAVGYALASGGTFVLTFAALHREVDRGLGGELTLIVVVLAALALAGAGALAWTRGRGAAGWEALAVVALAALALVSALAPPAPTAAAVLFNVAFAALALGAVVVGYLEDELWLATAGLAVVTVDVFARFIDLSWGLLPRSAAFLGAGLLLIGLAFALERSRSRLAERMAAR